MFAQQPAPESPPTLPEVTVTAPQPDPAFARALDSPAAVGGVKQLDETELAPGERLDQALIERGWAQWDAGSSQGIAQGLIVRGFGISNQASTPLQPGHAYLNGHPDVAWRFTRDAATVESAALLGGMDATFLGAGQPGGALMWRSKSPTGQAFATMQLSVAERDEQRVVLDAERHIGPLQLRGLLAAQRQSATLEGVPLASQVGLLSVKWPYAPRSHVQWDLEQHRNQTPFGFGTVYAGGRFWLDQAYVDASRASADRQHRRQALYWQHSFGDALTAKAYAQWVSSRRNETLVGAFSVTNPTTLSGYYRLIDEHTQQTDWGVELSGRIKHSEQQHQWTLAWQQHRLNRRFSGPQNIGGFNLDVNQPIYPANLNTLTLTPRDLNERYIEQGLAAGWRVDSGLWQWRAGARWSRVHLDSASDLVKPPAPVMDSSALTHALGVQRQLGGGHRLWLSHGQSFLPNRGQLIGGAWLPASRGRQWELGWGWSRGKQNDSAEAAAGTTSTTSPIWRSASVTLFDITQSDLPAKDPTDPNYFINLGRIQSRGAEVQARLKTGALHWDVQASALHLRTTTPTSTAQGPHLPGVAAFTGSLRAQWSPAPGLQSWVRLRGVSARPGDSTGSFWAPGYAMLDVGLTGSWAGLKALGTTQPLQWGVSISNLFDRRAVRALTGADTVWQAPRRQARLWVQASW